MAKPNQRRRPRLDASGSRKTTINDLTDPILCHILSFLNTETAVATSILSRRWRNIWEHLQVFHFSFNDQNFEEEIQQQLRRFVSFVDGVLARRRVPHVQKFRLSSDLPDIQTDFDSIANWIDSVVGPQLQELNLFVGFRSDIFPLPQSVLTCSALVSLILEGYISFPQLSSVHFPSLKNLGFHHVSFEGEVLSGCPVLETLELVYCDVTSIHMPPSLKRLTLTEEHDCPIIQDLEINTPSLEYLEICISNSSRPSISNLHNVLEAHIDCDKEDANLVRELLTALCRIKHLVLTSSTTECLLHAPVPEFPEFCGLLHLVLSVQYGVNGGFVIDLLHKCPMLQVLKIRNTGRYKTDVSSNQTLPSNVPKCVVSELTTFEFEEYVDLAVEHALIAYILQSGLVLKIVRIGTNVHLSLQKKHHILKKLSDMPRGSNMCRLKFE